LNWEIVGATGEWVGAAAVVVTLFYLARQISVNAKQLERQIDSDLDNLVFQAYDPVYQGRNAEIMFNGLYHPETISGPERYTFDLLMHRHAHVIYSVGERFQAGEISEQTFRNYASHYRRVLVGTPGGGAWFKQNGRLANPTLAKMGLSDLETDAGA